MNYWKTHLIRLRAIEPEDARIFYEWNQDSEMARNLDFVWPPGSFEAQKQWAEKESTTRREDDSLFLVIENMAGQVVGMISTHHCDRRSGTFSYGVGILSEHKRKGYAREAILLVLRYYFGELRYQKVTVDIHANNPDSVILHEKLGFQPEGRLRRMFFSQGEYHDSFYFGLTAEEFTQKYLA